MKHTVSAPKTSATSLWEKSLAVIAGDLGTSVERLRQLDPSRHVPRDLRDVIVMDLDRQLNISLLDGDSLWTLGEILSRTRQEASRGAEPIQGSFGCVQADFRATELRTAS